MTTYPLPTRQSFVSVHRVAGVEVIMCNQASHHIDHVRCHVVNHANVAQTYCVSMVGERVAVMDNTWGKRGELLPVRGWNEFTPADEQDREEAVMYEVVVYPAHVSGWLDMEENFLEYVACDTKEEAEEVFGDFLQQYAGYARTNS